MAQVLYNFSYTDPNNVGMVPPSVVASSWFANLMVYFEENSITNSILFESEEACNTWLAAHTLTDPTLLADLAAWKSTHNITLTNNFYTLTLTSGYTPMVS
jgi:hypothetical protein